MKILCGPCLSLSFSSFIFLFFSTLIYPTFSSTNETDRLALLEFKSKITNDPLGIMTSWNSSLHFCQWHGITCGLRHQRVTVLNLMAAELSGSISPHIGNLSFLRHLRLGNNSFSSEIPPEIGRLHRLTRLALYNNLLTGSIPPNISSCSDLEILYLDGNKLVGEIPLELTSMEKIKIMALGPNNLTGTLPPSLGNVSSLELFFASRNNFHGVIPESLGQLIHLNFLGLRQNQFSGIFPSSIFNLSLMETFDVGFNYLKGKLPMNLDVSFPNIQLFSIDSNQFSGTIPTAFSNASNLAILGLAMNNLFGRVPSLNKLNNLLTLGIYYNNLGNGKDEDLEFLYDLTNATALERIHIDYNNFGGKLPEQIVNFSKKLDRFTFSVNQMYGKIPIGLELLDNLILLDASSNKFTGTIPSNIGKLQNLGILNFSNNNFIGNIPPSIGNLTNLIEMDLSYNKLQGMIPSKLGSCKNLLQLDLSNNNLTGSIPVQIFKISSLSKYLDLSSNQLSGSLPNEVGNLKQLGILFLQQNMLSGEIPGSLGDCNSLETLDMSHNLFEGDIPSSLSGLKGLRTLDLSYNNLSGKIPKFFMDFQSMERLNISYNHFEGIVPTKGIFKNASQISLEGNINLCGGIGALSLPACEVTHPKKRFSLKLKIIFIVSAFVAMALGLACLFLWLSKKRKTSSISTSEDGLVRLSYQSLLKATNSFSIDNLIGSGSFGSVYKGTLEQDGSIVAVKVLNLRRRGATKSFLAECKVLRNVRHRNIVKVLTACSSIDFHGNDFKALVYEFMDNGSLHDWLHPNFELDETSRVLNFLQRLNIAIDVACALDYLHNHYGTPIIHYDLKPSNVLLDKEMVAHVSDFGLVKFLSDGILQSTANQSSSLDAIGTIGYIPPEYGLGSDASTTGDIFSFGILLLEMFTGKSPTDVMFKEEASLRSFAKNALPQQVTEILDPILLHDQQHKEETSQSYNLFSKNMENNNFTECLISIFEIGISCSSESAQERLNIGNVVSHLSSVKNKILSSQILREKDVSTTIEVTI